MSESPCPYCHGAGATAELQMVKQGRLGLSIQGSRAGDAGRSAIPEIVKVAQKRMEPSHDH